MTSSRRAARRRPEPSPEPAPIDVYDVRFRFLRRCMDCKTDLPKFWPGGPRCATCQDQHTETQQADDPRRPLATKEN